MDEDNVEKIYLFEPPNEDESNETYNNFYLKADENKPEKSVIKGKPRTLYSEERQIKKQIKKEIRKVNHNNRKKNRKEIKQGTIPKNKIFQIHKRENKKNAKRARTPVKQKPPKPIIKKEKVAKIEQKKEKKYKEDEKVVDNDIEEEDISTEIYDNTNMFKEDNNNFSDLERDDKVEKEELCHLSKVLSNDANFQRRREIPENDDLLGQDNLILPQTAAQTIHFQEF